MSKPLVALFGKMKVGKDAVATELSGRLDIPTDHFAWPLYAAQTHLLGPDIKDREWMQDGSKYLTDKDEFHFVKLLADRNRNMRETGLVIADCRKLAEYAWCTANDFLRVRLVCDRQTQIDRGAEPGRLDHITETQLDYLDEIDGAWDLVVSTDVLTPNEVARCIVRSFGQVAEWEDVSWQPSNKSQVGVTNRQKMAAAIPNYDHPSQWEFQEYPGGPYKATEERFRALQPQRPDPSYEDHLRIAKKAAATTWPSEYGALPPKE